MNSNKGPDKPTKKINELGLELVNFYSSPAQVNFVDDVSSETLKKSLAGIRLRKSGSITSLDYSRQSTFAPSSPWHEMSITRSNSYAAAVHLLRLRGINSPVLISVSQIQGYLKYIDDQWFSALESALDQRVPGTDHGRLELGSEVTANLKALQYHIPEIADTFSEQQKIWNLSSSEIETYWLRDPFQFKPLSFYESNSLARIWFADRVLMQERSDFDASEIQAFNAFYESPASGAKILRQLRSVFAKVSNRSDPALFSVGGVAELINPDRRTYSGASATLWPPSSPGILERLNSAERAKYDRIGVAQPSMDEIVRLVKTRELSLKPNEDEGFMIHQRYAIEPLLTFEDLPEGRIVKPDAEIRALWDDVYKAASAKIQETHQKSTDAGAGAIWAPMLRPERLWIEPIPSYYLRQYQAYSFLRNYAEGLPADFLRLWSIDEVRADQLFDLLANQMLSLYVLSSKQLGLSYDSTVAQFVQVYGEEKLLSNAGEFLLQLEASPAMQYDQRFMAVQGRPGGPKSENCQGKPARFWATLGIEAVPIHVTSNVWKDADDDGSPVQIDQDMVVLIDHFNEVNV